MQAQGQVYKVFTKQFGSTVLYSIKLESDDKYYGTGRINPNVQPGEVVSFEFSMNAKGYPEADVNTISRVTNQSPVSGGGRTSPPVSDRQLMISYQAAHNTAIGLLQTAVATESLTVPGKNKGEKLDALRSMFFALSDEIFVRYQTNAEKAMETALEEEAQTEEGWDS